jgi:hypothetical protein
MDAANTDVLSLERWTLLLQLTTGCVGASVAIPNVSPGKTVGSPNWRETRTGRDSQPLALVENLRRYGANPRASLLDSQPTYASPGPAPVTSMM